MFEKFLNIFRVPDLRRRVLFTLGILAVYRLGAHITTPGVNVAALENFFNNQAGSSLGLVDLFSGGNLRRLTIFALGIMPYITASIIFQLLTVVYEPLAKLQKEGELGRRDAGDLCGFGALGAAALCQHWVRPEQRLSDPDV
jgi:preprotein translocase subunit SecY